MDEIELHNKSSDAWVIVNQNVYDVTKFLPSHPGGDSVLLPLLGQDVTDQFELMGHSIQAKELLETMHIGYIDNKNKFIRCDEQKINSNSNQQDENKTLRTLTKNELTSLVSNSNMTLKEERKQSINTKIDELFSTNDQQSKIVDLSKPLLPQVYTLSHTNYIKLTKEVKRINNNNKKKRYTYK